MKILITAQGDSLESEVDPRFGRAKNFILFDTETGDHSTIPNTQNIQAPQGAGIQAGRTVTESGARAVLTGNCGPKAFRVLSEAGIKVYVGVKGTVQDAIEAFRAGKLTEAAGPDVAPHW